MQCGWPDLTHGAASGSTTHRLETVIDVRDGRAVLAVRGEVDAVNADEFAAALETAIGDGGRVDIDLRDMAFMDSSGLAVLMSAHRRLGQSKEALVLLSPRPNVRRLLDITGIDALFDVRDARPTGIDGSS